MQPSIEAGDQACYLVPSLLVFYLRPIARQHRCKILSRVAHSTVAGASAQAEEKGPHVWI